MNTSTTSEKGTPQSRTYTVNDIAAILGIGRATAYKLAKSGLSFPSEWFPSRSICPVLHQLKSLCLPPFYPPS